MKPDVDLSVLRGVVIRQGSVRIDGFKAVEAGDSLGGWARRTEKASIKSPGNELRRLKNLC
jgi:hypothetical protein